LVFGMLLKRPLLIKRKVPTAGTVRTVAEINPQAKDFSP